MNIFESSVKRLLEDDFGSEDPMDRGPAEDDEPDETDLFGDEDDRGGEEEDYTSMSLSGVIDAYLNKHDAYRWQGEDAAENLTTLVRGLGYDSGYGDPLAYFLGDNPGLMEKIIEWIGDTNLEEWKNSLIDHMYDED